MTLLDSLKAARRVSTPLVAINTPDPSATVTTVSGEINGDVPKVQWDYCNGLMPVNEEGREAIAMACACPDCNGSGEAEQGVCESCDGRGVRFDPRETRANPPGAMALLRFMPARTMVFVHSAHRFLEDAGFVQAVNNLRDQFKQDRRTLVLLAPSIKLPIELVNDVVVFEEALPDQDAATTIIRGLHEDAGLECDDDTLDRATAAVLGLPAFQIEQQSAMCLTREGLDLAALWEAKRRQIEQTPGLKVFRDAMRFDDLGGLDAIKRHMRLVLNGRNRPNCVVWVDEGEKALAGRDDMTGITADQIGVLLQYMEDSRARGFILFGHPGTGKSAIAKAAGPEVGKPTIQCDLGSMMGSLVGQSQQAVRNAVKVIDALSGGKALWVLTCNRIDVLPPELQARFSCGTYFFDLPTEKERATIWDIQKAVYELSDDTSDQDFDTSGWVGRDIRNCCDAAWDMEVSIREASQFVNPVSRSCPKDIETRQAQADGKYLDASRSGVFVRRINRESAIRAVSA
ncbi:AAA family ATPase [Crocinitomicaceae bacterium]|nr:AAA family ATPase [Crocinitomicaceae bacterium]